MVEPTSTTVSNEDVNYREWAIALGATTAVFLVTTLLLACILFIVVCRKITRLRKERERDRVTGMQGEYIVVPLEKVVEYWLGLAMYSTICSIVLYAKALELYSIVSTVVGE